MEGRIATSLWSFVLALRGNGRACSSLRLKSVFSEDVRVWSLIDGLLELFFLASVGNGNLYGCFLQCSVCVLWRGRLLPVFFREAGFQSSTSTTSFTLTCSVPSKRYSFAEALNLLFFFISLGGPL